MREGFHVEFTETIPENGRGISMWTAASSHDDEREIG
jgi:hypothetical protein